MKKLKIIALLMCILPLQVLADDTSVTLETHFLTTLDRVHYYQSVATELYKETPSDNLKNNIGLLVATETSLNEILLFVKENKLNKIPINNNTSELELLFMVGKKVKTFELYTEFIVRYHTSDFYVQQLIKLLNYVNNDKADSV